VDVAQLAGVGDLLELRDAGVVLEQMADHQQAPAALGSRHGALGLGHRLGERLLDEAVLAGLQHALGQGPVGGHRRRQHHGVELGIGEQIVQLRGEAGGGEALPPAIVRLRRRVAAPRQLAAGDRRALRARFGPQ
jgi:hypothetical protein